MAPSEQSPVGGAIFPLNALLLGACGGSDSFIPGLWPITASDPAMVISLL